MAGTTLLDIKGVETYYGNIRALNGVDVTVNQGEIVALIGANGAGKSTLMMTIFGSPRARAGTITFAGTDITQMPTHEIARMRIAQSPEGRRIFPRMTVMENLQMGASLDNLKHYRRGRREGVHAVPAPEGAHRPARRHAFGRRAADAVDRTRADGAAEAAVARRAVARPGAADRQADLRGHPRAEPHAGADRVPGRAERIRRAEARRRAAMSWSTAR